MHDSQVERTRTDQVLAFPRTVIDGAPYFASWRHSNPLVRRISSSCRWIERFEAEEAVEWIQPIPCAIIRDSCGRICALRRISDGRNDLRKRISLVIGGHIDWEAGAWDFEELLDRTLAKELLEEVGVSNLTDLRKLGIAIDTTSIVTSRHVAVVYELIVDQPVQVLATEEFSRRSKYSGQFVGHRDLQKEKHNLDPWSRIIFELYLAPAAMQDGGRQMALQDASRNWFV